MPRFRKRPVFIDASRIKEEMTIIKPEGVMTGYPGDWLITGVDREHYFCKDDEHYFCKDDLFRKIYQPIDSESYMAFLTVKDGD